MFAEIISVLPVLATLIPATTAIPLQTRDAQATSLPSATVISYFVDDDCDSSFNRAYQSLSNGTCMNLGQDATTRSLQLQNLTTAETSCMIRVYNGISCGEGDETEEQMMELDVVSGNSTCVGSQATSFGRLGSAMLVC